MGRKVVSTAVVFLVAVLSAGLVGGQVGGGGFLWWGTHEPIYIYGDDDFTIRNGVMSGSGTADDPYVIEGWRIEAPDADYGIYIDHTSAHFIIRDCVIERARLAGIYLNSVVNGRIDGVQISLSDTAVYFLNAHDNYLTKSVIAHSRYGVVVAGDSRYNYIVGNSFIENGLNGRDPWHHNFWYDESGGNYWSDYTGIDADGDGVGDEPYYALRDAYPLIDPPVEWTEIAPAGYTYAGNTVAPDGSLVVNSQTPITLTAADPGSGLSEIRYSIDGGEFVLYTGPIHLTGDDGPRRITYYAVDKLGNAEKKETVSFILDNHPPQTAIEIGDPKYVDSRGTWVTSKTRISLELVASSTYGRTVTYFRIDGGGWQTYVGPFCILGSDGPHRVSYYSQNASGIAEPVTTITIYKDDTPPVTRGAHAATSVEEASPPSSVKVEVEVTPPEEAPPAEVETAPPVEEPAVQTAPEVVEEAEPVQSGSETEAPEA